MMKRMMDCSIWAMGVMLLAAPAMATCTSGDCQTGAIGGPYTAAQVAEFTSTAPFPICQSSSCSQGAWSEDQIEGIDAQQNIGSQYQFYDTDDYNLDDNIAVGPTVTGKNAQVLEWVNDQYVQAFDKVTGLPIFTFTGGTTAVPHKVEGLWSSASQPECQGYSSGNVQVIYDRLDNEFVMSRRVIYTNGNGIHQYAWCIAVSSNSDLSSSSTKWYAYEFRMSTVIPCVPSSQNCTTGTFYYYFPDWPRIGTWSNGFYITFDLEDPTKGYSEAGFEACRLDRADIAQGKSSNPMTCYSYLVSPTQGPSLIHSVDVADIDSATGPPSGEAEHFLSIVNPSNAQQGFKGLKWCTSQTTPCTSNQLALFTWGTKGLTGPAFLAVNPYTPGCYNTSKANGETNTYCVPEPSSNTNDIKGYGSGTCGNFDTPCLDSLGDRMANRLTYNHLATSGGPNGEFLTASHVVMESASNQRTGIRYYILSVASGKVSVLVNSGGSSGPPDLQDPNGVLFYLMPSAALDQNGNLGITYTSSGAYCSTCQTQNTPAINFDVLPWTATTFAPPTLIVQGTGDQENVDRFGEYAATVIDSSDHLTFYGVGQYYDTRQTGLTNCSLPTSNCHTWQTRIFRGKYGTQF
jgi:hypothetical protein